MWQPLRGNGEAVFGSLMGICQNAPRTALVLVTISVVCLFACGTSPKSSSDDVVVGSEDTTAQFDGSDPAEADSSGLDSMPVVDSGDDLDSAPDSDTNPTEDGSQDVPADSDHETGLTDSDDGGPDLETEPACEPVVACSPGAEFSAAAAANPLLIEAGSLFTCVATDRGAPLLSDWSLVAEGSSSAKTEVSRWTLSVATPGSAQMATTSVCGATAPVAIEVLAPAVGTLIVASWTALNEGFDFDADLYVRPNAAACWNRPSETLVAWTEGKTLDWGVASETRDDPHAGSDSRWSPGLERVRCDQPSPTEVWEVGVRVPSTIPDELGPVRLRIWSAGSLVADVSKSWPPGGGGDRWWQVGSLQGGSTWSPDDLTFADREQCADPCDGGGFGRPEYCDGVDNDCDGTVDDNACSAGSACLFIAEFDEYRCLAP